MTLRPGVIVQETEVSQQQRGQEQRSMGGGSVDPKPNNATATAAGSGEAKTKTISQPEVLRSRSGPVEIQVPGRLSRSAYKVRA